MKILLTGQPKAGKSTLFASVLAFISNKQGFITQEIRENGVRVGFKLLSAAGDEATLAHIDLRSEHRVSRYFVDVAGLTQFIQPLFNFESNQLLYIDEIGQMELFADDFKKLVEVYLQAKNDCMLTITSVYTDAFVERLKKLNSALFIELTPENREQLYSIIIALLAALPKMKTLSDVQQQKILLLANNYFKTVQYIQLQKLFVNAIRYVSDKKISQIEENVFLVNGNTSKHRVIRQSTGLTCDCNLFTGRELYNGTPGECSHIQAIKLHTCMT